MRIIIFSFLFLSLILKADLVKSIKINGSVLDMVTNKNKIFIATDKSKVLIYDKDLNFLNEIKVRKVKDFLGELIDADIYSVDVIDNKILLLAQANDGYSELFIYSDKKLKKIIDKSLKLYAKSAKFVDNNHVLLALMSDEIVLYDIKNKKVIYRKAAGEYYFSTMAIDKSRKLVVIGDEGGEVIVVNAKNGNIIKKFVNINKDKILALAINKNLIIAGSRDKKLSIYNLDSFSHKIIEGEFFVYAVAISPDNRLIVYGDNEKYNLKVIDSKTFEKKFLLKGHKNIVNKIIFLNNKVVISGSESGEIKKWRLK